MSGPLVSIEGITKIYDPPPPWMRFLVRSSIPEPVVALRDVSFEVAAGQICTVIGPNGAGKSTLFRILTGLTTPTSGTARVAGLDPVKEAHKIRRLVGFMPADDRTLYLRHTCRENLVFHGRLQGITETELRKGVDEVLELVGLSEVRDRAGFALSSGMRARLQLARAILHEPRVLILDEPTGTIDPIGAFDLLRLIQRIGSEHNLATLMSSHRVEEIETLQDNLVLLDLGSVVYWGDLDAVRRRWDRPRFRVSFTDAGACGEAVRILARVQGTDVVRDSNVSIIVSAQHRVGSVLEELTAQLPNIESITERPMPLSELMRVVLNDNGDHRA